MGLTDRLNALDENAARRFPMLFHETPRTRAWMLAFYQVFILVCLFLGMATDNDAIIGAIGGAAGLSLGIAIGMLRSLPPTTNRDGR